MRSTDRPLRGILYVNIGLVIDAFNEALVKFLTVEYSPIQIGFVRSLMMAVVAATIILVTKRYHLFVTRRIGMLSLRGALSAVSAITFYYSLANLDLADAYTVSMSGPIFVAMLSGWLLGERVPLVRWLAIGVGLFGVAVVMRPGAGIFNVWSFLALLSALTYAIAMIVNRKLTVSEHSQTIIFYLGVTSSALLLLMLPFDWKTPPLGDAPLLVVVGLVEFALMYLFIQAYRYAAANTIVSFDYLSVFYVIVVGFIVFAEVPSLNLMFGVVLLIASGLVIVLDEGRQHKKRNDERRE